MSGRRWDQIEALFLATAALEPPARQAFLRDECGTDPELQRDVESLLRAEEIDHDPLARMIASVAEDFSARVAESRVGERVGAYRLVDVIGHGGMGTVYLAERADDAYRARVAIKFVRGAHAAPDLTRRFLAERQILADLNHPGIARLLDGGATVDGTPYLVLEYVDGVPMDTWCDAHGLGIRDRIALMLKVCEAVQFAHDARVVHRDLKPSNILVTGAGEPKLVDFGIARLLGETSQRETATGLRVLTPAYASPEQIRGDHVTVAADVYSLGVVLFQLIAGRAPFDLTGASAGEVERRICHEPPPPLSRAAGHSLETLEEDLADDLDRIVARALRKRADERYPSVSTFAAELRKALSRPARRRHWYSIARVVRRHRVASAGSLLAAGILVTAVTARALADRRGAAVTFRLLPEQNLIPGIVAPFSVSTADVNGDGRGDLLWNHLGASGNELAVGLGQANGTLVMQRPVAHPTGEAAGWDGGFQLLTGDFDGDGRDDVLWNRAGNNLPNVAWVGFSNGDGTFRFGPQYTAVGPGLRWGAGWTAFVGDHDGDGSEDLVFSHLSQANQLRLLHSRRDGTFTHTGPIVHFAQGWQGYRTFLADVNGDRRDDIVWNDVPVWANRTYVARSRGEEGFDLLSAQNHEIADGWEGATSYVADFDGDGMSDIIWAGVSGDSLQVSIARGQATAEFRYLPRQRLAVTRGAISSTALIGDFNGDGRGDLCWFSLGSSNDPVMLRGTKSGVLRIERLLMNRISFDAVVNDSSRFIPRVVDLNGDRRSDIVWSDDKSGRLYVALAGSPDS